MVTHETNGITRRAALGGLGATAAAFAIPARAARLGGGRQRPA
jgi:hypothetical protein